MLVEGMQIGDELVGNFSERDICNIEFTARYEGQQQIKGALKISECESEPGTWHRGCRAVRPSRCRYPLGSDGFGHG